MLGHVIVWFSDLLLELSRLVHFILVYEKNCFQERIKSDTWAVPVRELFRSQFPILMTPEFRTPEEISLFFTLYKFGMFGYMIINQCSSSRSAIMHFAKSNPERIVTKGKIIPIWIHAIKLCDICTEHSHLNHLSGTREVFFD